MQDPKKEQIGLNIWLRMVSQGQKVGQTIISCIGSNFHLYRKTGCDSGGESNGTVLSASTNRVISSVGACYWRDEANVQ